MHGITVTIATSVFVFSRTRLERSLEDVRDDLSTVRVSLSETETSRDDAATASAAASTKLQASEERLLRSRREHDLLQAERSVWQVARSGIQEELAKVRGCCSHLCRSLNLSSTSTNGNACLRVIR